MKFYMFRTVPLSIIRSFSLYTQQWCCHAGWLTACEQEHLLLFASCHQTCMTYTIAVCTVKNSWWWTEELSETSRVSFQNKNFEKLVHLVGSPIKKMDSWLLRPGSRLTFESASLPAVQFSISYIILGAFAQSRIAPLALSCLSICSHVSARLPLDRFPRNLILGSSVIIWMEYSNVVQPSKNVGHFTRIPQYILLLLATLYRHNCVPFEWDSIRLLG